MLINGEDEPFRAFNVERQDHSFGKLTQLLSATSRMRLFRFTLPVASLGNGFLFLGLFLFFVFQIFLCSLHTTHSGHRSPSASPMMEDFIRQRTSNHTSMCIPFTSLFAPTKEYQQSATLPQWMKGMKHFWNFLRNLYITFSRLTSYRLQLWFTFIFVNEIRLF